MYFADMLTKCNETHGICFLWYLVDTQLVPVRNCWNYCQWHCLPNCHAHCMQTRQTKQVWNKACRTSFPFLHWSSMHLASFIWLPRRGTIFVMVACMKGKKFIRNMYQPRKSQYMHEWSIYLPLQSCSCSQYHSNFDIPISPISHT